MASIGEFTGFPPAAFDVYESAVRIPMESLLARADDDGWGNGKVFRPNRDVRFSKDKRPYKTHCGAGISFRDGSGRASSYAQVDADGLMAGTALKRGPRGYALDHPRIELLRHNRLAAIRTWTIAAWMHTTDAYDRITGLWRAAQPLADWLETHVGAATEPPRRRGE